MFRTHALSAVCGALLLAATGGAETPEAGGTWRGRVQALVVDNFQAGTSRTRFFLHTPEETLELQGAEAAALRSGQVVEVTGRVAGKRLVVSHLSAQRAEADAAAGACPATGEQKTLVILASYPSKALLSSVTPELMRASFFGTGFTVEGFLRESSFGQTWPSGEVVGPFVLDADYFDQPLAARDAALRAAGKSTDLTKYTRIFVVGPQGQMGMDSGGMALIGCGQISTPQGELTASSMWLGAESMLGQTIIVQTAAHEFGHGLGLEHARWADYGGDTLGPAGSTPAAWDQIHDYGDSFSDMGRQSGQWAAPHKALLGWLEAGTNIRTVTASGNFTLSPYELAGSGQALKVSRDGTGTDWLWLEYRQPLGTFDSTLPAAAFAGALVHYEDPALTPTQTGQDGSLYTNLVNFHTEAGAAVADNPTLHTGDTWTDPYGNLSLTVNSANASALNVTVSYAPAPTCPSSVGAAQAFAASGGAGRIPVTAPAACSWTAAASVPWIAVGSAGSGTGTGSVSFTVTANVNVAPRWGRIVVGGAFVVITQAGAVGSMTISPQSASFSAAGGDGEIAVATSAPDMTWDLAWDASWITDVECSCFGDIGSATIRYIVAMNAGPARTTTIHVGGLAFTVNQDAGAPVAGSLIWSLLAPHDAPSARMDMAMAPFGHSGQAILYGGSFQANITADTWLWDGSNWTLLNPAANPGPLGEHAMAYDETRGNIVLFGGTNLSTEFKNETWLWDGFNWRQVHPARSPSARHQHAMAWDAATQSIILFGGYGTYGEMNDTWTWDGTNWTQATSAVSPLPRTGHSMAFDAAHGELVMFGGMKNAMPPIWFSDTWLWDAKGWHQALTPTPPAARSGHVLAYHPALHSVVMIGGIGGKNVSATDWNQDFHKEVWTWDGARWTERFPENQPGPSDTLGAAYDDTKKGLTVHLGDDLTCVSRGPKTLLLTTMQDTPTNGLRFVPVTPCRVADTRRGAGPFGGPSLGGGESRSFAIPQSACGIPSTAQAYSLNVTVVPKGPLSYLSLWPTGQVQPMVSTLNSFAGEVVANAAIVPAGSDGAVSVFATDPTDAVLDINGYFDSGVTYSFYATPPCRVADTRGGRSLTGDQPLNVPVASSGCGIPSAATAYSMNVTAVPKGYLGFLTAWPTGQSQPDVSTLNSWTGKVVANAALVPAGENASISVYASDPSDVILDTNGYFGTPGGDGALSFYPVAPCRVADTRGANGPLGGPEMAAGTTRSFPVPAGDCSIPATAAAYSLNVTVVPDGYLGYLAAWPTGSAQPGVSTLNSWDGAVVANAAVVPAGTNGGISIHVTDRTQVILDINGYFAK